MVPTLFDARISRWVEVQLVMAVLLVSACSDNTRFISWVPAEPDALVFVLQDSGTRALGPYLADGPIEFELGDMGDDRLLVIPLAEILAANPHIDSNPDAVVRADLKPADLPECAEGSVTEEGSLAEIPLPSGSQLFEIPLKERRLIPTSIDAASYIAQQHLLLELRDNTCPSPELTEFLWSKEFFAEGERLLNVWRLGSDEVLLHTSCCLYYIRRGEGPVIEHPGSRPASLGYVPRNVAVHRDGGRTSIAVAMFEGNGEPRGALARYTLQGDVFTYESTLPVPAPLYSVAFGPNDQILAGDDSGFVYLGRTDSSTLTRIRLPEAESVERVGFTPSGEHLAATGGRFFHGDFLIAEETKAIVLIDRLGQAKKSSARGLELLDPNTVIIATAGAGVFEVDLGASTAKVVQMGVPKPRAPCDLQRFCTGFDQVTDANHMSLFAEAPQHIFVTNNNCGVLVTHRVDDGCTSDLRLPVRRAVVRAQEGYLTVVSGDQILEARWP